MREPVPPLAGALELAKERTRLALGAIGAGRHVLEVGKVGIVQAFET